MTEATLDSASWQVVAIAEQDTPASSLYRLEFSDGRIGGRFGCNSFGGAYKLENERLVTSEVASTLMACPEPAAQYEARGLAILARPMEIEWCSGNRLRLRNAQGVIALQKLR